MNSKYLALGVLALIGFVTVERAPCAMQLDEPAPPKSGRASSQSSQPSQSAQPGVSVPANHSSPTHATALEFKTNSAFPALLPSFMSPSVPGVQLTNSPRLHELIHNGKLELSVQDAIALALENNMDIAVARYNLPLAQTDYLRTKAGGAARGVQGGFISNALFAGAIGGSTSAGGGGSNGGSGGFSGGGGPINLGSTGCCDPIAGFSVGWNQRSTPLNTLVVAGTPVSLSHYTGYAAFFTQGFLTGTSVTVVGSGNRQSTNQVFQLFNPSVPAFAGITINQPLLKGFGYRANAASLRIAKNDLRVADSVFRQQVIASVAQVLTLYYTILYDRENVRVAQEAVNYDQRLLNDNKKQVEIGTLAPIEVVRAESQLATDQQNLVVAQTTLKEDQEKLKTAIAKQVGPELASVDIEPTDKLPEPKEGDIPPLDEALKEAVRNRPEVEQASLNLRNQSYVIQSTRNGLLPTLNAYATYGANALSGVSPVFGPCPAGTSLGQNGTCQPGNFQPPIIGSRSNGATQALTQILHGTYPDYSVGVNLQIPIRNRQAQADAATALLQERQLRSTLQRQQNQVEQDVRNAVVAVTQAKAQIIAAQKATELARQTLDAERKKFRLGESTTLNVILTEQQLTTAEGNEAKARSAYAQALVTFGQATADLLDRYNIKIADAKTGEVHKTYNIPGTRESSAATSPGDPAH
jgi:outer membrane protein